MASASEIIQARAAKYNRVETAVDALGRTIGVKQLKPSQQLRIQEMAPGLDGTTTIVDERTGEEFKVAKATPLVFAASVVSIEDDAGGLVRVEFPSSRRELDAMVDNLDSEGLVAVMEALAKFAPKADAEKAPGEGEAATVTETAKN